MKKIISMALICAILFSAGLTSNINAAESTKSTESKLKANQSEQKELDEKINDLNEKIKKVEENIDSANEKMEKLNEESESLQKDIKKLTHLCELDYIFWSGRGESNPHHSLGKAVF